MKMFLTRIGFGSTAVITGDVTQVDLPRGTKSGLRVVEEILAGMRDLLGRWGVQVLCADTVDAALGLAPQGPDVLLVDYHLHDRLDGLGVIAELRRAGHTDPIWLHGAMERMCRLYQQFGVDLGELRLVSETAKKDELRGSIVVCPPGALNDRWSRRLPDPITTMASGWMRVRQRARQRNVELPLVISDHADWHELTRTIEDVNPAESWITHGREEALLRWCQLNQRRARALALVGYEDEDD